MESKLTTHISHISAHHVQLGAVSGDNLIVFNQPLTRNG